jgi:glycosyltransferase 2 family protein
MFKQKGFWLGIIVSLVLLAFVFYQTDPAKIAAALSRAQYEYLLPALVLYFVGVGIRAVRWHFLLRSIKPIPTFSLFRTVVIGYMANDILPARMGELVRAYVLGRQENVSKTATLVTIVVERVFDGLTMLTFIVAASFFLRVGDAEQTARFQIVGAVFIAAIVGMAILAGMPHRVEGLVEFVLDRLPSPSLRQRASGLTRSILEGLGALRSPVDSFATYALSILAWLCETGMYALIAVGFKISLPFAVYVLAAAFANLVTIAPSTPGYVGVFDAPIVITLVQFGVDQSLATSYTLILHAALYLPVTLLGIYYAWRAGISLTQVADQERQVPSWGTRSPD